MKPTLVSKSRSFATFATLLIASISGVAFSAVLVQITDIMSEVTMHNAMIGEMLETFEDGRRTAKEDMIGNPV